MGIIGQRALFLSRCKNSLNLVLPNIVVFSCIHDEYSEKLTEKTQNSSSRSSDYDVYTYRYMDFKIIHRNVSSENYYKSMD